MDTVGAMVVFKGLLPQKNNYRKFKVKLAEARAIDCVVEEAKDPSHRAPFKGNIDVVKMKKIIKKHGKKNVGLIVMTVTNNSAGGQPVSVKNLREVYEVAKKYGIPVDIDAARFAENAYFIKQREEEFKNSSIKDIVKEVFKSADMFTMSAKKDLQFVKLWNFHALKN